MHQHNKAVADYNEALRLRPEYPEAYYNLACLYSLRKDIEPCVENLKRATELDKKHKEQGSTDPDLEWARQDPRVRDLLGMS